MSIHGLEKDLAPCCVPNFDGFDAINDVGQTESITRGLIDHLGLRVPAEREA